MQRGNITGSIQYIYIIQSTHVQGQKEENFPIVPLHTLPVPTHPLHTVGVPAGDNLLGRKTFEGKDVII